MFSALALAAALSISPLSISPLPPDRALVAMPSPTGGVYLSWRLLKSDAPTVGFDVYRVQGGAPIKVNSRPITATSDFIDAAGNLATHDYYVTTSGSSRRTPLALEAINDNAFAISYPGSSHGRKFATADLDGDGRDDFVMRHASNDLDPSIGNWHRVKGTFTLAAFTRSGESLWRVPMGQAIEQGSWYSPFAVHDLDGDGRAEVIIKAGDEKVPLSQQQDDTGRVVKGPEYLRILDGRDGHTILAQTAWPSRTGFAKADPVGTPVAKRKYNDYNYYSRNFIAIGYLDGVTPHVIVNRGTYGKHKVVAYTYTAGKLKKAWSWENVAPSDGGDPNHWGQGAHSLQAADIDGDGRDEVILGSLILNGDGTPRFSIGHDHSEHLDHVYIADLDPSSPGLEMYYASEWWHNRGGAGVIDLRSGTSNWSVPWYTHHLHGQGLCADIDARYAGIECYSVEHDRSAHWLMSANGALIANENLGGYNPRAAWWDQDEQKELLGASDASSFKAISNYPERDSKYSLPFPKGTSIHDRQYLKVIAVADVLGDWREEFIVSDRSRLIIYSSNVPATFRSTWLMQDRLYRLGVTNSSSGYYQQPQLGRPLRGR